MPAPFNGHISVDVRDSTPDWTPYTPQRAPEGAPNVLIVLYDDTGLAAWEPYGGRIRMPTHAAAGRQRPDLHAVAHDGAVLPHALVHPHRPQPPLRPASPASSRARPATRARTPTCRARRRRSPRSCAATAGTRTGSARTTTCPPEEANPGGPKFNWPLQQGFDRFYGFLGGETNQWYPDAGRGQPRDRAAVRCPRRATTSPRTSPTRRCRCCATASQSAPSRPVVHVALPRRQPRAAPRRPRRGPTSTRASSTTATRPTASGCWRG